MVNRDPKNILSAMRRHLQKGERITSVVPMSIGHSNETYRLEGAGSRPANAAVASRTRRAGPRYAGPVRVVCGIAWSPRRSAGTGGAIPVRRRGPGRCAVLPDGGGQRRALQRMRSRAATDGSRRAAFTRQWCEAIVSVDRQPPLDVLGAPLSITAELDRWRDVASAAGNNELVKHFGFLYANVPPLTRGADTCPRRPQASQLPWRDGELVSLLDWEMSFNGDPAWGLGYMLIFLPGDLHPRSLATATFAACGAAINSSRFGRKGPDVLSPTVCGSRRPPMQKSHR